MKKHFLFSFILALGCMCGGESAAQSSDNGNGTFTNPVLWADVPDPDVIRVGDDYYMVSTTMHLMPGAKTSYNLEGGTVYGRGQWATSLRYRDGKYYAYFSPNDTPYKGYVYTTDNPAGEWTLLARTPHFHDASLFFDDDGRVYVFYGTGQLRELKPDLTGVLVGGLDTKVFERDSEENGLLEGSRVIKHDGKYYLIGRQATSGLL